LEGALDNVATVSGIKVVTEGELVKALRAYINRLAK